MTETGNPKQYDLEERALRYAGRVIEFVRLLPKTIANNETVRQVIRSGG